MNIYKKSVLAILAFLSFSWIFGWQAGAILLIGIGIHEYGHKWAMEACGVKTKGLYFIPFAGGVTVAEDDFQSRQKTIFISLMGPVWGLGSAVVALVLFELTHWEVLAQAALIYTSLNLFNLIPIYPLDGGRVYATLATHFGETKSEYLVYGVLVVAYFIRSDLWIFLIIAGLIVGKQLDWLNEKPGMAWRQWKAYALMYGWTAGCLVGLLAFITTTIDITHELHLFFA